jgi:undecaprenyl diphosphate synthase
VPKHVAIIMDGNGRWAKQQGKERFFGHMAGAESVRKVVKAAMKTGVEYLTLYAFSTENWNRPEDEVIALMGLLVDNIYQELPSLQEQGIRLHFIGDRGMLPTHCLEAMHAAEEQTAKNSALHLILALSYSSRWEIMEATKRMIHDGVKGESINETTFHSYLSTRSFPDPELMIRTSGEHRISNFLLWQLAYAELFFTPQLWPDFNEESFYSAIQDYQTRERRFGKTSEQMQEEK